MAGLRLAVPCVSFFCGTLVDSGRVSRRGHIPLVASARLDQEPRLVALVAVPSLGKLRWPDLSVHIMDRIYGVLCAYRAAYSRPIEVRFSAVAIGNGGCDCVATSPTRHRLRAALKIVYRL